MQPGNTIGIMGATGAGKTSIIQLLQRLYDATDGNVYVDDVDIRNLSLKQLRSNISLVMQDVFLFSDTISENVKLGKRGMVDASTIRGASACAQASEFIEKLDEQYETVIGERGVGLSGGQKQRISIARAIAKKNPILVLDDSCLLYTSVMPDPEISIRERGYNAGQIFFMSSSSVNVSVIICSLE